MVNEPVTRPTPPGAAEQVARLPRRVAHAVYALQALTRDLGTGPWRASEIVVYDAEAMSVAATSSALRRAMYRHGLVDRWGLGLWTTTPLADDLSGAIEDRYLRETEKEADRG